MTRSERFIESYKSVLHDGCEFYNPDAGLMSMDAYAASNLKLLIVFPSSSFDKTHSMTPTVLLDWVKTCCPGVFIDFAFLPHRDDIRWYDKEQVPYAIGISSHLDPSHFDIVGFSISCLYEIPVVPWMLATFSRCDRPIPLSYTERNGRTDVPLIYAGGASVVYADVLFGSLGDGRYSYLDFMYLGQTWDEKLLFDAMGSFPRSTTTVDQYLNYLWYSQGSFCFYQPQSYSFEWSGNRIVSTCRVRADAPDHATFCLGSSKPEGLLGAAAGYIRGNGGNTNLAMVSAAEGCGFAGNCSFCAEGHLAGGLQEESQDTIVSMARVAKLRSASDTVKLAAYNLNYLTDWKGTVAKVQDVFPTVTFSNMRMEELGKDEDAMELLFALGFRRGTAPIEGVSPRIWNSLYNKGLSEEALEFYMRFMIHRGCLDIKIGLVLSGYEEESDWQWLYGFTKRWLTYAASRGGKLPIRFKATPLVQYPLTPLECIEKRAARLSFDDGQWISSEWYSRFTDELGVRFEVNGYRYSTLLEQALVSFGRRLTPLLHREVASGSNLYKLRSLRDLPFFKSLRTMIGSDESGFFDKRSFNGYISLLHWVHTSLDGVRRYQERKGLSSSGFPDFSMPRCLRTDSCRGVCSSFLVSHNPVFQFADASLGPDGFLSGSPVVRVLDCHACGRSGLASRRPLPSTISAEDIKAHKKPETAHILRFRLKRTSYGRILNPRATSHIFASSLLRCNQGLCDSFIRVSQVNSLYGQSYPDSHWDVGGSQLVDLEFRSYNDVSAVSQFFQGLNSRSVSFEVLGVSDDVSDIPISLDDLNLFSFRSDLPMDVWSFVLPKYDGSTLHLEGDKYKPYMLKSGPLSAPLVVSDGRGGSKGVFVIPVRCNPWYYIQAVLRPKRVHPNKLFRGTAVDCVTTLRSREFHSCKCCGRPAVLDVGSGKGFTLCEECLSKSFLASMR